MTTTMTASAEMIPGTTVADVRSYWDRRPCNIHHSAKPVASREYFDEVEARKYFVEPHIPGFAEFPRWAGKRVLEVGCGIGTDATNFARAGADYTGVDLSQESLNLARRRFEVFGLKGRLLQANAEEVSAALPGERFDLVYSFGVLHHTPNPPAAFAELRKLIRPDGQLRLMLYARNSWKNIMIEAGLDQPEAQAGCPVAFTYTHDAVREQLRGFRVVDIRQDHIFPYVIEKYVRHEYEVQPYFRAMPEAMFKALEAKLGWHTLITAVPV